MEMGESADFDVCIEKNNEYHQLSRMMFVDISDRQFLI
jgi:hypothetical protein